MLRCCSFSVAAALGISLCATALASAKPADDRPMTSGTTLAALEEIDNPGNSVSVLSHIDRFGSGQRVHWDLVLIG